MRDSRPPARAGLPGAWRRPGRLVGRCLLIGALAVLARGAFVPAGGQEAGAVPAAGLGTTNATALAVAAPPNAAPGPVDFSAFRIIAERNIFNAARSGRTASTGAPRENRRAIQVETVALRGTMSYEKGSFAFFDGSRPEFRKVLSAGDSIAGHTIREITPLGVRLADGTREIALQVNSQLRREDEGEWSLAAVTEMEAGSGRSDSGSSDGGRRGENREGRESRENRDGRSARAGSAREERGSEDGSRAGSAGDVSEVLKRLMQQREQELK